MRALRRAAMAAVAAGFGYALILVVMAGIRSHPEDWPWTPLDLTRPIGAATGVKLTALGQDEARCRALLRAAGVHVAPVPPVRSGACGYRDAVRFAPGGATTVALQPAGVGLSCPLAAAMALWEWDVLQPAAQARFGSTVTRIEHVGAYSCRHIVGHGSKDVGWSEHAHANALDVTGFRLADGARITVAHDWRAGGARAAFLRDVRAGACRLFATVLSPDYNAAHHDHLHLDQAQRGRWGWRACR